LEKKKKERRIFFGRVHRNNGKLGKGGVGEVGEGGKKQKKKIVCGKDEKKTARERGTSTGDRHGGGWGQEVRRGGNNDKQTESKASAAGRSRTSRTKKGG